MKIYDYKGRKNVSGDRIRQFREKQNLTQKQLAARLQVQEVQLDDYSVGKIERGQRFISDYELYMIAEVLGVEMADLVEMQKEV